MALGDDTGTTSVLLVPSSAGVWVRGAQAAGARLEAASNVKPVGESGQERLTALVETRRMARLGGTDVVLVTISDAPVAA